MTCRFFVSALARLVERELSPRARAALARHAGCCPVCDAYLCSYLQTVALVRDAYPTLDPVSSGA